MPTVRIVLTIEQDGVKLLNLVRRLSVDELTSFEYEEAADGNTTTFSAPPTSDLDTLTFVLLRTDRAVTLRLNDGTADANTRPAIPLGAGGFLLLVDTSIGAPAGSAGANNLRINNNAGATAVLRGLVGGT